MDYTSEIFAANINVESLGAQKYPNIGGQWATAPTYQNSTPFRIVYSRVVEFRQNQQSFKSFMIDQSLDLMSCIQDITPLALPFHNLEVVNDVTTYRQMTTNVPQTGGTTTKTSKYLYDNL